MTKAPSELCDAIRILSSNAKSWTVAKVGSNHLMRIRKVNGVIGHSLIINGNMIYIQTSYFYDRKDAQNYQKGIESTKAHISTYSIPIKHINSQRTAVATSLDYRGSPYIDGKIYLLAEEVKNLRKVLVEYQKFKLTE